MNNDFYAILPLIIVYEEKYSGLSSKAILLYALLLNRKNYSMKNKKFNDSNGTFIYYSSSQICKHLRCGKESARKTLNELKNAELVKVQFQKFGLPLKIYVNDIREVKNEECSKGSETSQDKPFKNPYSNSFNKQKPYTNKISQEEKQVSFDTTKTLSQIQKTRRNFGDMKLHKKKKED